jgi:serine phosphatase RsbU (regulator of sigma subunit)
VNAGGVQRWRAHWQWVALSIGAPLVPAAAMMLLPPVAVLPLFWFLLVVVLVTAFGGRTAGVIAAGVSLVSVGLLVAPPRYEVPGLPLVRWTWLLAVGVGCLVAVLAVDTVLGRAIRAEDARREAERATEYARAEWRAEHRLLELVQRAMLPAELPQVAGAELAATYLAAADRLDIGGDWYDAFPLPDGRVALSIGDVVGHDHHAVAIMGPVRAALRAYATEDPHPGRVLARLNRFVVEGYRTGMLITALVAVFDPETGELTWANAGHPAPMLARPPGDAAPGGRAVAMLREHGAVLGAFPDASYPRTTVVVPLGAGLFCYTDGLAERRQSSPEEEQARLERAVVRAFETVKGDRRGGDASTSAAQRLVDEVTAEMLRDHDPEDDICLLVLLR